VQRKRLLYWISPVNEIIAFERDELGAHIQRAAEGMPDEIEVMQARHLEKGEGIPTCPGLALRQARSQGLGGHNFDIPPLHQVLFGLDLAFVRRRTR